MRVPAAVCCAGRPVMKPSTHVDRPRRIRGSLLTALAALAVTASACTTLDRAIAWAWPALPTPYPIAVALAPTATPFPASEPTDEATITPSAHSAQESATPALDPSPTDVPPSATATSTSPGPSLSAVPVATMTPLTTATATRTRTATATASPAPSPTRTATPSATASAAPQPVAPTATPTSQNACAPTGNDAFESELIGLINQERTARGLGALAPQSQLTAAARVHSSDMACNDFVSHTGSDGSSPGERVARQGYSYSGLAENIYAGGGSPSSVLGAWMNSAGHRDNLLNAAYTEIGIGYRYRAGSTYGAYITAVLARP